MPKRKSRADNAIEGTMDIFGDLKKQGKGQSGLDDDVFGFKAEAKGKKKGKKNVIETPYGSFEV